MMGFKDIKQRVLECLKAGRIQHEARNEIDVKNLMQVGLVSVEEVVRMLNLTRGDQHKCSPHHFLPEIEVHEFRPEIWNTTRTRKEKWYIKPAFTLDSTILRVIDRGYARLPDNPSRIAPALCR